MRDLADIHEEELLAKKRSFDRDQCSTAGQVTQAPAQATNTDIENYRIAGIQERLRYHSPTPNQLPRYQALRDAALAFSTALVRNVPSSIELDRALEMIENTLMTANKGIALGSIHYR